jgi:hypothetical protein
MGGVMRFLHRKTEIVLIKNEHRLKKAFLWFWKTIDHETRWMEKAEWIECHPWKVVKGTSPWIGFCWVPDDQEGEELLARLNEIVDHDQPPKKPEKPEVRIVREDQVPPPAIK